MYRLQVFELLLWADYSVLGIAGRSIRLFVRMMMLVGMEKDVGRWRVTRGLVAWMGPSISLSVRRMGDCFENCF
jgi:hypothetical protein